MNDDSSSDSQQAGPMLRRSARIIASSTRAEQIISGVASVSVTKRRRPTQSELPPPNTKRRISAPLDQSSPLRPSKKSRLRRNKARLAPQTSSDTTKDSPTFQTLEIGASTEEVREGIEESQSAAEIPVKSKRKRKVVVEQTYVIPDVEKKTTTFRGRLGYACLNTVLRNKKPASETIFCSRTCRLDSLKKNGMDWVKGLGRQNVQDLLKVIQWNEDNNIRFFRLSSEMFPFASHAIHGYSLDYCAELLAEAGALANKHGHRLTTHPGQYTQLGSPKPAVVEAAVRELAYHCEMLDLMGIGPDGVMIIHGGGMYDDKTATLGRIKETVKELSANIRSRLVLENDELCYNAEDLLPICEELDVPLVFDYHHDSLFPSSISPAEIIERANKIWKRRGIKPKQHLSEQRPGAVTIMERRAHADRCENLPADLPDDMDLMIEAKDKEQAVLHFYRMYDLHPVIHANLRPPATNPTKQTAGRKSSKRARIEVAEPVIVEDEVVAEEVDEQLVPLSNIPEEQQGGHHGLREEEV